MNKNLIKTTAFLAAFAMVSSVVFAVSVNGYGGGATPTPTRSSSRGRGGFVPVVTPAPAPEVAPVVTPVAPVAEVPQIGMVLGESTFAFNMNLREGMRNEDVRQLQERLRAEGFFTFHTSTGFFGPITRQAVMDYQQANFDEIGYVTGFFGPLTRAVMNR